MRGEAATVEEALGGIAPGASIVVAGCSGVPSALLRGLVAQADRLRDVTLYSGMLCGADSYAFLRCPGLRYVTWHMPHAFMRGVPDGRVEFLPIPWSRIDRFLAGLRPDVALVHVSPAVAGNHSLGVSVGYHDSAVRHARQVIAQVNDRMPRTRGEAGVRAADIDVAVEVSEPLVPFEQPTADDPVAESIGDCVAELVPDGAVLQIGVGTIPSATLNGLRRRGKAVTVYSLATDEVVDLARAGGLCPLRPGGPSVVATESLGTQRTWDFLAGNDAVHMVPSTRMQNPLRLARLRRFHSVNSCLEIDLLGQCNSEVLGGRQISGIGGSIDFIEGSWLSEGGRSIVALPSTTRAGRSRIVPSLAPGTPVTLPRHALHTVVTEHGVAELFGRSDRGRRDALIDVAHPDHRAELRRAVG